MRKILSFIILAVLFITSCKDNKLFYSEIQKAAFVYFEELPDPVIGVESVGDVNYTGTLYASGPVANYKLEIYGILSGVPTDTAVIGNYTEFPVAFTFTTQDIINLLGITINDINFGDTFGFIGTVTAKDGTVYYGVAPELNETFDENGELIGSDYHSNGKVDLNVFDPTNGYKTGFAFNFVIGCPVNSFNAQAMAGTYQWIVDPWETWVDDGIFEVVAGPCENQITCIDVFDHPVPGNPGATYDMTIDVDPATGAATVAKQNTWDPLTWGISGWGTGYHSGGGYVFGCIETITLNLEVTTDLYTWGVQPYVAVKIPSK